MAEIKKLYALDIPAVGGTQTIWIAEELHQLPIKDAVAAHFGISRDHVIQWLNLVEDQGCQARRKDGLACRGQITPSDIPATPDLFNPHTLYACPAHVNRSVISTDSEEILNGWYISPEGFLVRIVERRYDFLRAQYRTGQRLEWAGTWAEFEKMFKPF